MKPKYIPDMATVLRETDPAKRKRDFQQALANADRPTPPMFWRDGAADAEPCEVPDAGAAKVEAPKERAASTTRQRTRALFVGFAVLAVAAPLSVVVAGRGKPPATGSAMEPATTTAGVDAAAPTSEPSPSATTPATAPSAPASTATLAVPSAAAPSARPVRPPVRRGREPDDPYRDTAPASPPASATTPPAPPPPPPTGKVPNDVF
jgi:hypothetical protein